MRSLSLPAASLAIALCACAPGLRPIGQAGPAADVGPADELVAEPAAPRASARTPRVRPPAAVADATARPVTAPTAASAAPSWDLAIEPYLEHERVAHFVTLFSGPARARIADRLGRGTRYEALIRERLRAAELPEDLYYLALVESGFDPHAYSRAAAVGMWQFMTTTARAVGLRVDWWVDDRRDPVRATDAAVRHLRDLRRQFGGSAYLAAAAYNGGSGRISRGLGQHAAAVADVAGDDRFFALAATGYLRDETRDYVPQIIAVALVGKASARFGLEIEPQPPLAYDSVTVPAATPLAAVAAAADTTLDAIAELNGRFLRGMTPPEGEWEVRLPEGRGAGFAERLASLPDSERVAVRRVSAEKGEAVAALARRHDLSERQLGWYNPSLERDRKGRLAAAQSILVPTPATLAAALDVADPAVEIYGSASTASRTPKPPRTHEVAAGESLDRIARRYDLSVAQLKKLNGLKKDLIRPGQQLRLEPAPRAKRS